MKRHGKNQAALWLEHASQLVENATVVFHVFDHVKCRHEIERTCFERQFRDLPRARDPALGVQALDHGSADINKMGTRNREPRPESGTDLEPVWRERQKL